MESLSGGSSTYLWVKGIETRITDIMIPRKVVNVDVYIASSLIQMKDVFKSAQRFLPSV